MEINIPIEPLSRLETKRSAKVVALRLDPFEPHCQYTLVKEQASFPGTLSFHPQLTSRSLDE